MIDIKNRFPLWLNPRIWSNDNVQTRETILHEIIRKKWSIKIGSQSPCLCKVLSLILTEQKHDCRPKGKTTNIRKTNFQGEWSNFIHNAHRIQTKITGWIWLIVTISFIIIIFLLGVLYALMKTLNIKLTNSINVLLLLLVLVLFFFWDYHMH